MNAKAKMICPLNTVGQSSWVERGGHMGQSPALRKYCRSQDIPIQAWTHLKYIRYLADKMELKDLHVKLR